MNDALLDALAALYVLFAAIDLYVDWQMVPAARERPHIDALTISAIQGFTVTIGGLVGAVLGINAVALNLWQVRLVPAPLSLVLLAVALGAPSFGKLFSLRAFRRWAKVARLAHVHKRASEPGVRYHRRATDITPEPNDDPPTGIG